MSFRSQVAATDLIGCGDKSGEAGFDGVYFQCEPPHENINGFKGSFSYGREGEKRPLFLDNILLRGCALRNTDWVVGFVVYTGK